MSDQYNDPRYDEPMPGEPRSGSNVLGIVGFILAFCISPVGLLVSLIALFKRPRGFAIAGVIVGLLGSAIWGVFIGFGVVFGPDAVKAAQTAQRYGEIEAQVTAYQAANDGALPPDLGALQLPNGVNDGWGNPMRFEPDPDGTGWILRSAGFDAQFNTEDDFVFQDNMSQRQVQAVIEDAMTTHYEKKLGAN